MWHTICTDIIWGFAEVHVLTWNLPVSARAWASVQGQSMSSFRKFGRFSSRTSHFRHLLCAQASEFSLKACSRCQANTWPPLQRPCTSLCYKQNCDFGTNKNKTVVDHRVSDASRHLQWWRVVYNVYNQSKCQTLNKNFGYYKDSHLKSKFLKPGTFYDQIKSK